MSYPKADLIQDIRHMVQDNPWETTSSTTDQGTTVVVPDPEKWAVGDIGEWSFSGTEGGEQFLVQDNTVDLTVLRGYNGTTKENHTSGDRVVKNPRFSVIQITDSIDRVVNGLYPSAWKKVESTVTPNTTSIWFDSGLTGSDVTGMIDLIRGQQRYGTSGELVGAFGGFVFSMANLPFAYEQNLPSALVSSTVGVRFPGGFHHSSNAVTIQWRAKITSEVTADAYDDIDEGLLSECIANGVCARLLRNSEVPNLSQDQRLGQSDPGVYVQTAQYFDLRHREILTAYQADLNTKIPPMRDQKYMEGWM
jgi:hypothetical protein